MSNRPHVHACLCGCCTSLEAERDKLKAQVERYEKALKEIVEMGGHTLLGTCCVNKDCRPYEEIACELRYKVSEAFYQAANVAKAALAEDGE